MNDFKKIMLGLQAQSKAYLNRMYTDYFSSDPEAIEDEKVFYYGSMEFWFQGTGKRNTERILMMIALPVIPIGNMESLSIPIGTYLLGELAPLINEWNENNKNDNKAREKAQFFVQKPGTRMLRRNGVTFDQKRGRFVLRLLFQVPLINAVSVNGKAAYRGVSELLNLLTEKMNCMDQAKLKEYVLTYLCQQRIRSYLKANGYCAFVANGSILPREKDGEKPMQGAIPFVSPKECEVVIPLFEEQGDMEEQFCYGSCERADHSGQSGCVFPNTITGMAIPCGITIITGGGYSGKSTLLDALEVGIYNHVPGDGREFVIAEESALKAYAEDGRPVSEMDLSAFFRFLPGKSLDAFSTDHASGSVSQASNILEAVSGGSKLLLIDEDKSATNFMIRDQVMRRIVEDEPIIPFTERVTELWKEEGVSTILVIGGSSEYLKFADQVFMMKDYRPHMITGKVKELLRESGDSWEIPLAQETFHLTWKNPRRLHVKESRQAFLFFRTVETENEKKIILDDYSADVTMLTALSTHEQLCTATVIMERLLTDASGNDRTILENVEAYLEDLTIRGKTGSIMPETQCWFYEEIRPLDALCCINRMRGVTFVK